MRHSLRIRQPSQPASLPACPANLPRAVQPGQFYRTHHDQNTDPHSLAGVRLFTFFIYLHTPEAGGQTYFPNLNISVEPRRGSALLWPNVRDDNLHTSDMRTEHEAKPPTLGRKFSANLWLHMYDFRGPNVHGCDLGKRYRSSPPANWADEDWWEPKPGDAAERHVGETQENDSLDAQREL